MNFIELDLVFVRGMAISCCLLLTGCGNSGQQVLGVSGSVKVDSVAAPAGTAVSFVHVANDSDCFTAVVNADGVYEYASPGGIVLKEGEYVVSVRPKRYRTELSPQGIPIRDVPIPGAPTAYGKYSDAKTSNLRANLSSGRNETFDIDIHSQK